MNKITELYLHINLLLLFEEVIASLVRDILVPHRQYFYFTDKKVIHLWIECFHLDIPNIKGTS